MQCKDCGYTLWNLRSRTCPECGRAFAPSEFDFIPNSVRFCCPHCQQPYYGADERGHLVPPEFACVSCGRPIAMDEMVLLPAEGVQEHAAEAVSIPWTQPRRRGRFRDWYATVWMSIAGPRGMADAIRRGKGRGGGLFGALTLVLYILIGLSPLLFLGFTRGPILLLVAAAAVVIPVICMIVWGVSAHMILMLTGPRAGDVERTISTIGFGSGVMFLIAIPCLSVYLSWIGILWWIILAAVMLAISQQVSGWRAVLAVLPAPLIAATGLLAAVILGVQAASTAMSTGITPASIVAAQFDAIGAALLDHVAEHGRLPAHAAELLDRPEIHTFQFLAPAPQVDPDSTMIAGASFTEFMTLANPERRQLIDAAAAALPASTIAHRLGDFVFTYHGIDPADPPPGLWIVIESWNHDAEAPAVLAAFPQLAQTQFAIYDTSRAVRRVPTANFDSLLEKQNALRATHGLPPLPHPSTVTHTTPATAPDG